MDFNALIRAEREKSAKAFAAAQAIKDEFAAADGDIPADKMAQFDKAIEDSTAALERVQQYERQAKAMADLDEAHRKPVNDLPTAGRDTHRAADTERREEAHKAAWHLWQRGDRDEAMSTLREAGFSRQEAHALISGDDSKGGFLAPSDVRNQVIERRAATAVMRGLVQVVPTSRDMVEYPRIAANGGSYATSYQSGFAGEWDTELGSTTETSGSVTVKTQQNQPTTEMVRIQVHNWIPKPVIVSTSLLEDSAAPFDSILSRHIATTAGLDEDYVVITGSGVGQPAGIVNNSDITTVNSGSSSALTYGGLLDLIYGLPAQYSMGATLLMRRATMGKVLALETGSGVDLVFKNTSAGPNNLLGYPVVFSDFMPAVASSAEPIIFGNFADGYVLADRQDLRIQRLNERYAPNVGFAPTARIGGAVVLPEAFRIQTIAS